MHRHFSPRSFFLESSNNFFFVQSVSVCDEGVRQKKGRRERARIGRRLGRGGGTGTTEGEGEGGFDMIIDPAEDVGVVVRLAAAPFEAVLGDAVVEAKLGEEVIDGGIVFGGRDGGEDVAIRLDDDEVGVPEMLAPVCKHRGIPTFADLEDVVIFVKGVFSADVEEDAVDARREVQTIFR